MEQRSLQQNTRVSNGTLEYGWRPATDTTGDPSVELWTTTTAIPVGYVAWTINQSAFGTTRSSGFGRWAICPTCLEEFPIQEMVNVRGKYYCTKYNDYEEQQ
jgi:hypothetical protein